MKPCSSYDAGEGPRCSELYTGSGMVVEDMVGDVGHGYCDLWRRWREFE